ncbi:MAG: type I polyketide synthase, partial [Burkholderiaceae bacterium]
ALAMAVMELQLGESDMAITGGVDTLNDIFMYMCFSKTPALSPSGDCRPFSDQADGTMLGEGLGMIALKRLSDAERDGDRIYAVLKGVGTSSDGRSKSVYAPVSEGQSQALKRAYEHAGYAPETVELMEAHGTGTKAGDAAEFEGLRQSFSTADKAFKPWCALGSVKSQIGHTKSAAGAAGLFKIIMALHHKVLPPTIKITQPNPKLALEQSPFYLNTQARPWIRGSAINGLDHPRRASVSSFGFGGTNFHLTLEEYAGKNAAERLNTQSHELIALSAASAADLLERMQNLRAQSGSDLHQLAKETRANFQSNDSVRLCVIATRLDELVNLLDQAKAQIQKDPSRPYSAANLHYGVSQAPGKLAFLYPGQGSQYLHMGADLALNFDSSRAVHDAISNLKLGEHALSELMYPRARFAKAESDTDSALLTQTEWAQPALAACSLANLAALQSLAVKADAHAGHSFGELSALAGAGVINAQQCAKLARARGTAMRDAAQTASQVGAMSAVSCDLAALRTAVSQVPDIGIANYNAPNQIVLSGPQSAIEQAESLLARAKIAFKRLPVASAFHSPMVAAASSEFAQALSAVNFAAPSSGFYSNTSVKIESNPSALKTLLAAQIQKPVRFVEMIQAMHQDGVRCFVEVGSGSVLSGLVGQILSGSDHSAIACDKKGQSGLATFLNAVAKIAALGYAIDLRQLFANHRFDLPQIKPGKMPIQISGANYGKPYPPEDVSKLPKPNPERAPIPIQQLSARAASPSFAPVAPMSASSSNLPQATASVASTAPAPSAELLKAFLETQAQTAAAHAAFQQALADSHNAYLRVAETALNGMNALLGVNPA